MTLAELLPEDHVIPALRVADKAALLAELGRRAAAVTGLEAAEVTASLAAREALGSTGTGNGIAVPHARLDGLSGLAGLFVRLERPIDFAAIDGKPVDLVFLLLSPAQGPAAHLAALAAMSRRLRDGAVAAGLRRGRTAASLRRLLVE
jgi:PTS system nitrogen regulatory IIA component